MDINELINLSVPELRKRPEVKALPNYHNLKRTEIIRELRLKYDPKLTKDDVLQTLKSSHKMLCDIVEARQKEGRGSSTYKGIREQLRMLIVKVERVVE